MSKLLDSARYQCTGIGISEPINSFERLYPFTTENISGYIDLFDLENTSLLTIGSSSDQVINAALKGCTDITLLDICPYTESYYYLKTTAMQELDYEDFLKFLCHKGYYGKLLDNFHALSRKEYFKLREKLKETSRVSEEFWTQLLKEYKGTRIRQRIFSLDEDSVETIKMCNPYLKDEKTYLEARDKIKGLKPKFITGNLKMIDIPGDYDNIWLSNYPAYLHFNEIKELFEKTSPHVKKKLLFSYLYGITETTMYHREWDDIYNLDRIESEITSDLEFHNFKGVKSSYFDPEYSQDAVLIYQKKK